MGREPRDAAGELGRRRSKGRPGLALLVPVAVVYNSVFNVAGFIANSEFGRSNLSLGLYFCGVTAVASFLSIIISVVLDARLLRAGRVSALLVFVASCACAACAAPCCSVLLLINGIITYSFYNVLFNQFMPGVINYAVWSVFHLCIRSVERAIDQERRAAALREAMLRYENEALSSALDSNFFVDALMRVARALKEEAGVLAGEVVMSLAERMRTTLAPKEALPESLDEALPGSLRQAEIGEMTDAGVRRLLLVGALGLWAAFFCASFLPEFAAGRPWWKSLSDYGGQSIVGALWFVVAGQFLQKTSTYRVRTRCLIVFGICVLGLCACAATLLLSFALRGDLAWPPLATWIFGFELSNVAPIFLGGAAVYLLIDARRREIARLNAAAEIREAALNARNAMLRLQVNPHFLFNALNALYALILDRQFERARGMIAAVRGFLDRAGDPASGELVALSSELATQEAYLEIERVRFGDRLRVDRRIDAEVAGAKVPHLILQPLVENAVKYAVARTERPVAVEIRAWRTAHELVLEVADTGAPETAPRPPGLGVGLRNVEARLKSLYGEAGRLACRPLQPTGFLAEVRLPFSL